MKIYRFLLSQGTLAPLVPCLQRVDSALLRIMHRGSSRDGIQILRDSQRDDARRMLAAMEAVTPDARIERERAKLLRSRELLRVTGPFDAGMSVSVACALSKPPRHAALLASIVREFAPAHGIELGTNVGVSSAYIGSAMNGTLVTLEASSTRQILAKEMHDNLGISNVEYVPGLFEDTLDVALEKSSGVDFAFIDGHHQYQPTLDYCERIMKHANAGAVLVFDDIRWSDGMAKAWAKLDSDDRFGLVVDLWSMGVCVVRSERRPRVTTPPITCY